MASLFQRLMELGEESPTLEQRLTSSADLSHTDATREALAAQVTQLQGSLSEQKRKYEELMADATKLRSEYDAYHHTSEKEKRLMAQQREEDKRMLDELRRAGSTGTLDETYVKETEAKVQEMRRQLQRAQEEVQKAFQRQREAEHARAAAEAAKQEEVQELYQQFDRLKEAVQQRSAQLEQELSAAHAAAEAGASGKSKPHPNHCSNTDDGAEAEVESPSDPAVHPAAASEDEDGEGDHTNDNKEAVFARRERHLCASHSLAQDRLRRQLEESKWESVEAGKRVSELRAELTAAQAAAAQREAAAESAAEESAQRERDLRRALRRVEDAAALAEHQHEAERRAHEAERQKLQEEVARLTALSGEAATRSQTASDAVDAQRAHYESLLHARAEAVRGAEQQCGALHAALQDAREDGRKQLDRLEDLRRALEQAQRRGSELDVALAQSQRLIGLREEEVVAKEEERQKLRGLLREEEAAHQRVRQRFDELDARRSEAELHAAKQTARAEEAAGRLAAVERELAEVRAATDGQQSQLHTRDEMVRKLQAQLDDLITQSAKFAVQREEQTTRTRQLESRIRELEAERSAMLMKQLQTDSFTTGNGNEARELSTLHGATKSNSTTAQNGTTTSIEMLYAAPSERTRQQFVSEAVISARKLRMNSVFTFRRLLLLCLAFLIVVIVFGNYLLTPQVDNSESTLDALQRRHATMLKEHNILAERLKACETKCGSINPA